jgi:hypothetical protein
VRSKKGKHAVSIAASGPVADHYPKNMKLAIWLQGGHSVNQAWTRNGFRGGVRDDGVRGILTSANDVVPDDGSAFFSTAWEWCGVDLPDDTLYGVTWNDEATDITDLGVPCIDDTRNPNITRFFGKTFQQWCETEGIDAVRLARKLFKLRAAWKAGQHKPANVAAQLQVLAARRAL